ncbi:MAG: N-acetylmuramoyl-L-alanine amidase [Elusimicrobia bacterium]|nr:N-acetylmuramoyl-L-alanine amidase [Elusimicrobiota bacterium]
MSKIAAIALSALFQAAGLSAAEIKIAYPYEGMALPNVPKTFVFGSVTPSTAPFFINGSKIEVYKNGGFIAYVPVTPGDFSFRGELLGGATAAYERKVKVKPAEPPHPSSGTLYLNIISPVSEMELSPGDFINVQAEGTPCREAVFSAGDIVSGEALSEIPKCSGRYFGLYAVRDLDAGKDGALSARFKAGLFARSAETVLKKRIKILKAPQTLETSTDTVILRNGLDTGYMMFLPLGVKLVSDGKIGAMCRIRLAPGEAAWVEDSRVSPAPRAVFPPQTETGAIKLKKTETGSQAAISLSDKVPYSAEELENGLRITLYYAKQHTNWVVYDPSDSFVKNVVFRQTGENKVTMDFEFAKEKALWGYDIYYGTRALIVDFKQPVSAPGIWPKPLEGVKIALDPGHSAKQTPPYDGAIGPMGTFEYQANLAIALKTQEALSNLGAQVFLTRKGDETVQLADRPKIARDSKADIFISIHNNAIADGEDPFSQPRGFAVYYNQRHSQALGKAIHDAYSGNIPLPDEGLRYGDYLVVRMTYMPAVLIENVYMILPEQEEMVFTQAFQEKLAASISSGVLEFFGVTPRPGTTTK